MKKYNYLSIFAIVSIIVLSGFSMIKMSKTRKKEDKLVIPEKINSILQKSCMGCHSATSNNDKAKDKLNFSEWNKLSDTALAGKLENIDKVVSEGDMPPKKFLERFPDKKLSIDEIKILHDWARKESKRLSR